MVRVLHRPNTVLCPLCQQKHRVLLNMNYIRSMTAVMTPSALRSPVPFHIIEIAASQKTYDLRLWRVESPSCIRKPDIDQPQHDTPDSPHCKALVAADSLINTVAFLGMFCNNQCRLL